MEMTALLLTVTELVQLYNYAVGETNLDTCWCSATLGDAAALALLLLTSSDCFLTSMPAFLHCSKKKFLHSCEA